MWLLTRLGMLALVLGLAAASLIVPRPLVGVTHDLRAAATELAAGEDVSTQPTETDASAEQPEGAEWVVGLVIFVLAAVLFVGGRWWIRKRVGRLRS